MNFQKDARKRRKERNCITIYAEKPDVGTKIAAALDGITLDLERKSMSEELEIMKSIKAHRSKQGYLRIRYHGKDAVVTWGYGHMCGLKQAQDYNESYKDWRNLPLPYIPENHELKLSKGVEKTVWLFGNA